jgi:internalin A
MNKWIIIPIITILVAATVMSGVLYLQENNKLKDAQSQLTALGEDVSAIEGSVSTLEVDLAAAESRVAALEVEVGLIPVTFPDAYLEITIRKAINKSEGTINKSDLQSLTTLNAKVIGISDLTGLEYCVNLESLTLYNDSVSDISPLASLVNLTSLDLGANNISDISPLANLRSLENLNLWSNNVSDISPLSRLTNLEELTLSANNISDISPLARLTNLERLSLSANNISDISPLANLRSLEWLSIWGNNISDISPLVANIGLSAGDTVWLHLNPLSTISVDVYIPQLEAIGATIKYWS